MFAEAIITHHATKANPPLSTVGMLFYEPVKRQELHVWSNSFLLYNDIFGDDVFGIDSIGVHQCG